MSKKKSYMNKDNVLLENKLINAFKALLSFGKLNKQMNKMGLSKKEKKALKNPIVQKALKNFYKDIRDAEKHFSNVTDMLKKQGYEVD